MSDSKWSNFPAGPELDSIIADRFERDSAMFSAKVAYALSLWRHVSDDCTPRLARMLAPMGDHMEYRYKASILYNELHVEVSEEAESPALAICRCVLAYQDEEDVTT